MARKQKTKDKPAAKRPLAMARWWLRLSEARRTAVGRAALWTLAALAVASAVAWGMIGLEGYVSGHPDRLAVAVQVRLLNRPDWMPAALVGRIDEAILPAGADLNDPRLVERAHRAAEATPWIREVRSVAKRVTPDPRLGVLEVDAVYRRPVARVLLTDGAAYVADDGVRLPADVPQWVARSPGDGRLTFFLAKGDVPSGIRAVHRVHYIEIRGVESAPPAVGEVWPGGDVAAGLAVVRLVMVENSFRGDIAEVDVRNYAGRMIVGEPHIRLVAQRPRTRRTEILFGRLPRPDYDSVVLPEQKMSNLVRFTELHGGLAGHAREIDVRRPDLTFVPY